MTARGPLAAAVAVGVGVAVLALWPRTSQTPEDRVRAVVARCVAGAERRDVSAITEAIDESFRGAQAASRDEVKALLLGVLLRSGTAPVVLNPSLDVTVDAPGKATVRGTFVFARGGEGEGASRYQLDARLEERGGDWRFVWADWRAY